MANMLERGQAWLESQRAKHLSQTVVYVRGSQSVQLAATPGRTAFEQADEYGVIHRTESRDFLVLAADRVLDGRPAVPKAGDRIRETSGAQTVVYEVMAPGNEPPFRYSGVWRQTFRIHTKHVATE